MNRVGLVAFVGVCVFLGTPLLAADQFFPLPQLSVVQYGGYVDDVLTEMFKDRQAMFEVDLERGRGFYDGQEGIIALPIKSLSEEQLEKESGTRLGAPWCNLFMGPGFKLLAHGKPIEQSQGRFVKGLDHSGEESGSTSFVCMVRRIEGTNLELDLYGPGKEPVVTARFEKVPAENPTAFECKLTPAPKGQQALGIVLFGKYEATLTFVVDHSGRARADDLITTQFGVSPRKSLPAHTPTAKTAQSGETPSIGSQLQFDMQRSGYWREGESLPKAPNILWKYPPEAEADQFVPGTPVVDKGTAYFGDNRGRFRALNVADGKEKWSRTYKQQSMIAAPAIADGLAYIVTPEDLKCISLGNGELRWSRELPASMAEAPPLIAGDAIFVAGGDSIHAFKRANGEPIWRHGVLDDRPTVSPSFMLQFGPGSMQSHGSASDGSLLYQSIHDQCRVIALDCHTGKQSWSYAARGWLTGNPVVSGKYVLFGAFDLYVHCADRETGKPLWKSPTAAEVDAAPAVANGCVYFTARNSRVHCIDLETGKRIWMYRMDPAVEGLACICAPLVSDKTVFIGSTKGFLFALDALTGEFRWGLSLGDHCRISSMGLATDGKRLIAAARPSQFPQTASSVIAVGDQ